MFVALKACVAGFWKPGKSSTGAEVGGAELHAVNRSRAFPGTGVLRVGMDGSAPALS